MKESKFFLHPNRRILKTENSAQVTARSLASIEANQYPTHIKTEGDEEPVDSRLKNWGNLFGGFLSDIQLRRKRTTIKTQLNSVDPVYMREVPYPVVNNIWKSLSLKKNFARFLMGDITAEEFLVLKNKHELLDRQSKKVVKLTRKPILSLQRFSGGQLEKRNAVSGGNFLDFLGAKSQEVLKKANIQARFDKIRELIEEKVEMRQEEDIIQRRKDLQNLLVFKHMYDISDEYIHNLKLRNTEIKEPINQEAFSGNTLKVIKHQNPYQQLETARYCNEIKTKYQNPVKKSYIAQAINTNAQEYIELLKNGDSKEQVRINKKIFFDIKKQQSHQEIQSKNPFLDSDIELIKYVTNTEKVDIYKDKNLQAQTQEHLLDVNDLFSKKRAPQAGKLRKRALHYQTLEADSRSCDESITSMYEFNVGQLYEQSKGLQKKLLEKQYTDGFGKTIKTIQKNQQLKRYLFHLYISNIMLKNIQKLEGIVAI